MHRAIIHGFGGDVISSVITNSTGELTVLQAAARQDIHER
jgi:hypothetical protein